MAAVQRKEEEVQLARQAEAVAEEARSLVSRTREEAAEAEREAAQVGLYTIWKFRNSSRKSEIA